MFYNLRLSSMVVTVFLTLSVWLLALLLFELLLAPVVLLDAAAWGLAVCGVCRLEADGDAVLCVEGWGDGLLAESFCESVSVRVVGFISGSALPVNKDGRFEAAVLLFLSNV